MLVDVRKGSPTFGEWEGFDLTEENLHAYMGWNRPGFCVVNDVADVM